MIVAPPIVERRRCPTGRRALGTLIVTASIADGAQHGLEAERDDGDREQRLADHRPDRRVARSRARAATASDEAATIAREPHDVVVVARASGPGCRQSTSSSEKNQAPHERHRALGEVDGLRRLEDQHEPERDERVDRPWASAFISVWMKPLEAAARVSRRTGTAAAARCDPETDRRAPPSSVHRLDEVAEPLASSAARLIFCVAVSSPSSWSSSLGISAELADALDPGELLVGLVDDLLDQLDAPRASRTGRGRSCTGCRAAAPSRRRCRARCRSAP